MMYLSTGTEETVDECLRFTTKYGIHLVTTLNYMETHFHLELTH